MSCRKSLGSLGPIQSWLAGWPAVGRGENPELEPPMWDREACSSQVGQRAETTSPLFPHYSAVCHLELTCHCAVSIISGFSASGTQHRSHRTRQQQDAIPSAKAYITTVVLVQGGSPQ